MDSDLTENQMTRQQTVQTPSVQKTLGFRICARASRFSALADVDLWFAQSFRSGGPGIDLADIADLCPAGRSVPTIHTRWIRGIMPE